jgi:hypothetical protein
MSDTNSNEWTGAPVDVMGQQGNAQTDAIAGGPAPELGNDAENPVVKAIRLAYETNTFFHGRT